MTEFEPGDLVFSTFDSLGPSVGDEPYIGMVTRTTYEALTDRMVYHAVWFSEGELVGGARYPQTTYDADCIKIGNIAELCSDADGAWASGIHPSDFKNSTDLC